MFCEEQKCEVHAEHPSLHVHIWHAKMFVLIDYILLHRSPFQSSQPMAFVVPEGIRGIHHSIKIPSESHENSPSIPIEVPLCPSKPWKKTTTKNIKKPMEQRCKESGRHWSTALVLLGHSALPCRTSPESGGLLLSGVATWAQSAGWRIMWVEQQWTIHQGMV